MFDRPELGLSTTKFSCHISFESKLCFIITTFFVTYGQIWQNYPDFAKFATRWQKRSTFETMLHPTDKDCGYPGSDIIIIPRQYYHQGKLSERE